MKKYLLGLVVASIPAFMSAQIDLAYPTERITLNYIHPSADTWKETFGIQYQHVMMIKDTVAVGLSAGYEEWTMNDGAEGSANTIPLGVSVLYRTTGNNDNVFNLEAGLKYPIFISDLESNTSEIGVVGGLLGLITCDLITQTTLNFKVIIGLGYQFDIVQGSIDYPYGDKDNEMGALLIRAGIEF